MFASYRNSVRAPSFDELIALCHDSCLISDRCAGVDYFSTTIYRIAPIENSNVFLAGMCMASARLDILKGLPRESAITAAVKLEAVRLLNHSLSDPRVQISDETIMILTRLLHSEIIHGNFSVLDVHKKGLERIVQLRGGFNQLYNDSPASRWLCNAIVK